jgi:hypothetical protein
VEEKFPKGWLSRVKDKFIFVGVPLTGFPPSGWMQNIYMADPVKLNETVMGISTKPGSSLSSRGRINGLVKALLPLPDDSPEESLLSTVIDGVEEEEATGDGEPDTTAVFGGLGICVDRGVDDGDRGKEAVGVLDELRVVLTTSSGSWLTECIPWWYDVEIPGSRHVEHKFELGCQDASGEYTIDGWVSSIVMFAANTLCNQQHKRTVRRSTAVHSPVDDVLFITKF